jgi:hypothetical protein
MDEKIFSSSHCTFPAKQSSHADKCHTLSFKGQPYIILERRVVVLVRVVAFPL